MLSKNKIKFINSLELKKNRTKHNCFIVEGEKMVAELLLSNYITLELFYTSDFERNYSINSQIKSELISDEELKKISRLKTPNQALAVVEIPTNHPNKPLNDLTLALDNIQDPGNLGTIIRTANWFGIEKIYCSLETADAYNHKVVQATMGAIFRTEIIYCKLNQLILEAKKEGLSIYGALLSGENIYETKLQNKGLIVLGNESKGISNEIESLIDCKIKIPNYSSGLLQMESLNVGIANAIILAEFKRQN